MEEFDYGQEMSTIVHAETCLVEREWEATIGGGGRDNGFVGFRKEVKRWDARLRIVEKGYIILG